MSIFEKPHTAVLVHALLQLQTEEECRLLLEDLMTAKEIEDMAQRLQVAQLLLEKENYNNISAKTGASSTTISRVNRCVVYGNGGYKTVLERMD